MKKLFKSEKGFTLIEILVVIGIIALLAAIVIIAINPARQFAQARNTQRVSNVNALLNAVGQNIADNKGLFKCGSEVIGEPLASSTIGTSVATGPEVDLTCLTPTYIPGGIPMDPTGGTAEDTKYQISIDTAGTGRYMVCAPKANETNTSVRQDICVTR